MKYYIVCDRERCNLDDNYIFTNWLRWPRFPTYEEAERYLKNRFFDDSDYAIYEYDMQTGKLKRM